jgi:hypothetical protein
MSDEKKNKGPHDRPHAPPEHKPKHDRSPSTWERKRGTGDGGAELKERHKEAPAKDNF